MTFGTANLNPAAGTDKEGTEAMKYYVGAKQNMHALIFRSKTEPTTENHPINIRFCWGGYYTRSKAEQVAMYQNYIIENDWNKPAPIWSGKHNEDI